MGVNYLGLNLKSGQLTLLNFKSLIKNGPLKTHIMWVIIQRSTNDSFSIRTFEPRQERIQFPVYEIFFGNFRSYQWKARNPCSSFSDTLWKSQSFFWIKPQLYQKLSFRLLQSDERYTIFDSHNFTFQKEIQLLEAISYWVHCNCLKTRWNIFKEVFNK